MGGFVAGSADAGRRVDVVAAERLSVPRSAAQEALRAGTLRVGGRSVRPSYRLVEGDEVAGDIAVAASGPPAPEAIDIDVRLSDDRVLVVSKPAGLVTHPAGGHETGTLVNALLALGHPLASADPERPGIVHRLDKDTSGLLLVAKDDDALRSLQAALRRREVRRSYVALVRGHLSAASGTVDAPIGRHPVRRTLMAVDPGGRPAVTHYRVRAEGERETLLDVDLDTGRTHQIRVHLAHIGHPVVGDRTYGGPAERAASLGLTRPFLHAIRLAFPHPDDGREVAVEDPLPAELTRVLTAAGVELSGGR